MKTVLFVGYGGGHVRTLIPIVQEIQARHVRVRPIVFGATNATVDLERAAIPHLTYTDILPEYQKDWIVELGEGVLAENHNPTSGIPRAASLAYLGMNLADLIDKHGSAEATRLYQRFGRRAFLPVRSMDRLLDQVRPDLVVTTSGPRTEQAARQVALARGIPVLVVADVPDTFNRDGFLNVECTMLCLPSEFAAERWSTNPWAKAGQMRVTGNPVFDRLLPFRAQRRAFFPDPPRLLFAQQTGKRAHNRDQWLTFGPQDFQQHFGLWSDIAQRLDVEAKVRLHPSLDRNIFRNWHSATRNPRLTLDTHKDLADSVAQTSVLIGNLSTILTEALIVGTPVVQYIYDADLPLLDGLQDAQVTWSAPFDDGDALAATIAQALSDNGSNAKMLEKFGQLHPPPPATERVCSEILKLL